MSARSSGGYWPETPIVVDDFYPDVDAVRALALRQRYVEFDRPYPRAVADRSLGDEFVRHAKMVAEARLDRPLDIIPMVSKVATGGTFATNSRHRLNAVPVHTDKLDLTVIVYLTPEEIFTSGVGKDSGTSFYRHAELGLEGINLSDVEDPDHEIGADFHLSGRTNEFLASTSSRTYRDLIGMLMKSRFRADDWLPVSRISYRYNRAILFSGHSFHAPGALYDGLGIDDSRLVQLFSFAFSR